MRFFLLFLVHLHLRFYFVLHQTLCYSCVAQLRNKSKLEIDSTFFSFHFFFHLLNYVCREWAEQLLKKFALLRSTDESQYRCYHHNGIIELMGFRIQYYILNCSLSLGSYVCIHWTLPVISDSSCICIMRRTHCSQDHLSQRVTMWWMGWEIMKTTSGKWEKKESTEK